MFLGNSPLQVKVLAENMCQGIAIVVMDLQTAAPLRQIDCFPVVFQSQHVLSLAAEPSVRNQPVWWAGKTLAYTGDLRIPC